MELLDFDMMARDARKALKTIGLKVDISEKTVLFVARQPETSRQPVLKSVPLAWTGMQMGNKNKHKFTEGMEMTLVNHEENGAAVKNHYLVTADFVNF